MNSTDCPLRVDLAGEVHTVPVDRDLTFGRDADLRVDDNPRLHRRLGRFSHRDGMWWLHNTGSAIPIEVCHPDSTSRMTIAPGMAVPLPFNPALLSFRAGPTTYELELVVTGDRAGADLSERRVDEPTSGNGTLTASDVSLNTEQRLLLVALAQRRLTDPTARRSDLPANRDVADQLGWTITKFNRKLDYLCAKFDRLEVPGLKGDVAALAGDRRERLVDHVVNVGLIGANDLEQLETLR